MKRLVGIRKWLELRRAVRWKYLRELPFGFVTFLFGLMRFEKLTVLGDRTFVNTNYAPFPSGAYDTALDDFVRISRREHRLLSFCIGLTSRGRSSHPSHATRRLPGSEKSRPYLCWRNWSKAKRSTSRPCGSRSSKTKPPLPVPSRENGQPAANGRSSMTARRNRASNPTCRPSWPGTAAI